MMLWHPAFSKQSLVSRSEVTYTNLPHCTGEITAAILALKPPVDRHAVTLTDDMTHSDLTSSWRSVSSTQTSDCLMI